MFARPSRKALAAWDALREEFSGPEENDADFIDPRRFDDWPLTLSHSALRPRALYYFTKDGAQELFRTRWRASLPRGASFMLRSGVAPAHYSAVVRGEALRCRSRVRFIGDLDPQDLAIYLSLAFGDYSMRPHPRSAVPIVHMGINDAWLIAAGRAFRPDSHWSTSLDMASIQMTPDELRYLAVVEKLGPPLEKWVGPRCAALLRSGRKIEIEGILTGWRGHTAPPTRVMARLLAGKRSARVAGARARKRRYLALGSNAKDAR